MRFHLHWTIAALVVIGILSPGRPGFLGSHHAVYAKGGPEPAATGGAWDNLTPTERRHYEAEWAAQMQNPRLPQTDAAGGVDGVRNGGIGFHTDNTGQAPWWEVDLGAVQAIGRVVVYNRSDWAPDRARNLRILFSDDGKQWREVYRHDGNIFHGARDGKPLEARFEDKKARYVRTALAEAGWLHLDEIEVYAPGDADENLALHRSATQSSTSDWSTHARIPISQLGFGERERGIGEKAISAALREAGTAGEAMLVELAHLKRDRTGPEHQPEWVALYARACELRDWFRSARAGLRFLTAEGLRLAVDDLTKTFPERYADGPALLASAEALHKSLPDIRAGLEKGDVSAAAQALELAALHREILLANPLLDFDRLLLVKRGAGNLGLPANYHGNSDLQPRGYDNEIAVLSPVRPEGEMRTQYRPPADEFVGDVDLDFDAGRMLFSMPDANGRWQVFEMGAACGEPQQLPLVEQPDVNNYDACYLPDGNVIFNSTAVFVGVPCVTGSSHVTNLFLLDRPTGRIRQLTFDQDHDWCPTVLNNGRVLYLRWEYSDIPHYVSRILFHMNPDGTSQMEYYGSNSYWPNAMFYARPVPEDPTRFVAVVGGHHDVPRMGELVLFDPERGRHEANGVVQRIPGRGVPVEPTILDGLVGGSWPKFLHPYPLSDKYFLTSCKPDPGANWGIYLVDVFDNMTLIRETPGYALLEPVPFRAVQRPPVIPPKVDLESREATVYMTDVYTGGGLEGIPRGAVKQLRLFTYHFSYHGMGGQANRVGLDGPWDVKRIIGTVPVEPDGSALFRVPANTPISLQPLDAEGKALQLMRSWLTAMPGEVLSCVGCHERQNTTPPSRRTMAARRPPSPIKSWYGPTRGFSFVREVQPVLDAWCVRCHNGSEREGERILPNFAHRDYVPPSEKTPVGYNTAGEFPPVYLELRPYVRTPSMESDMHMLAPCDFHADASKLVQMLEHGHHGVQLSAEAWDRLITWIDLNAPAHGTWREIVGDAKVLAQRDRRRAMMRLYANRDEDPEEILDLPVLASSEARTPDPAAARPVADLPPAAAKVVAARASAPAFSASPGAPVSKRSIDLGGGVRLDLVRIPSGEFLMGDERARPGCQPRERVRIGRAYWIGALEVTNEQFARFDPEHDSRLENGDFLQFSVTERGYPVNGPRQPVVRVSWRRAMDFCQWLSEQTGEAFTLPTEAEWEYAARAGATSPFWYGEEDADFAACANLADAKLKHIDTFGWGLPSGAIPPWRPAIETVNDGHRVSAPVGSFMANPWGLHDVHGNVAEWTRTAFRPGPYRSDDGRNGAESLPEDKVVRGGSWNDRPRRAHAAFRQVYHPYQGVYDVGFRVMCPAGEESDRKASAQVTSSVIGHNIAVGHGL